MAKTLDWKTKYNYLRRYWLGESAKKLGYEIDPNALNPYQNIWNWNQKYLRDGIKGLKS